jgi:hypothetical protein
MADFEAKKLNVKNINGGKEFANGDAPSKEFFNEVVEGILYLEENGGNGGGTSIEVDSELSSTSKNPVQNNVITGKINEVWHMASNAGFDASTALETANGNESRILYLEEEIPNCVKKTDYANKSVGGVVRVFYATDSNNTTGMTISGNGVISLFVPTTKLIDDRGVTSKGTFVNAITVNTLDYAMKSGITKNTIELTAEEKTLACAWLGATKFYKHTFTLVENVNGDPIEFFITSPTEKYDIESESINLEIGSSTHSLNFATMIGIMENANFNTYKVCYSIQITKTGDLWTIQVVGDGIYKFWEGTRLDYSYSEV